jgi:hypothetical protein
MVDWDCSICGLWFGLWRPCNFTPTHSLTGPVGQPFSSRLGGQWFASRGFVSLYQWPCLDWLLASPWDPCQQWEASLGFAPTMRKASCDHTLPSPVPFYSLQVLLLLATQWPVRGKVKLLGGSPVEALQFHSNTVSLLQWFNHFLPV